MFPTQGLESFENDDAKVINAARLRHLETMGFPITGKTVLDVGCGVGHLAAFLHDKGGRVVCIDARDQNIQTLRSKYPKLEARPLDVETESLLELGKFQIVFCYGLLYHLENPIVALRHMSEVCEETLLLETIVTDHRQALSRIVEESTSSNEALRGVGNRPTPSYVAFGLRSSGFKYVYTPNTPPDHPDFRFEWKNNLEHRRGGHNLRCIFIASKNELHNPRLTSMPS